MLVFVERGNQSTRRKPPGAEKRTNKLNPHIMPESNPGHTLVGGECSYHCAIPAPIENVYLCIIFGIRCIFKKEPFLNMEYNFQNTAPNAYKNLLT